MNAIEKTDLARKLILEGVIDKGEIMGRVELEGISEEDKDYTVEVIINYQSYMYEIIREIQNNRGKGGRDEKIEKKFRKKGASDEEIRFVFESASEMPLIEDSLIKIKHNGNNNDGMSLIILLGVVFAAGLIWLSVFILSWLEGNAEESLQKEVAEWVDELYSECITVDVGTLWWWNKIDTLRIAKWKSICLCAAEGERAFLLEKIPEMAEKEVSDGLDGIRYGGFANDSYNYLFSEDSRDYRDSNSERIKSRIERCIEQSNVLIK